ncbi:hypothetical protein HY969_01090 [Candidatus Kaiserbacteria bacterium]|nr:hypothetical protein [Candidatus Kaiserbacteria bacterium]
MSEPSDRNFGYKRDNRRNTDASERLNTITPERIYKVGNQIRKRDGLLSMESLIRELGETQSLKHRLSIRFPAFEMHRRAYFAAKKGEPFPSNETPTPAMQSEKTTAVTQNVPSAEKRSFANLSERTHRLRENIKLITSDAKARGLDAELNALVDQSDPLTGWVSIIEEILTTPKSPGKGGLTTKLSLLLLKVEEAEIAYHELRKRINNP